MNHYLRAQNVVFEIEQNGPVFALYTENDPTGEFTSLEEIRAFIADALGEEPEEITGEEYEIVIRNKYYAGHS